MKILAIDQSGSKTGVCRLFIEPGQSLEGVAFDIDTFDLSDVPGERAKLLAWDAFIRGELACGYGWVFIERPIVASGPAGGAGIFLHKIAAVIELACAKRDDVKFAQVAGARIKKWAGSQKKQEVMLKARDRWAQLITDDNTADAAWLGDIALHVVSGAAASNQAKREVVRDVLASLTAPAAKPKRATARRKSALKEAA